MTPSARCQMTMYIDTVVNSLMDNVLTTKSNMLKLMT